jgi:hypothetical protein
MKYNVIIRQNKEKIFTELCTTVVKICVFILLCADPEVPGSIPGAALFSEQQWVWNWSSQPREDK